MAHYDLAPTDDGPRRAIDRDAKVLGVLVLRDDDYFQYLAPMVSGQQRHLVHPELAQEPRFWPAIVAWCAEALQTWVDAGAIPLKDPTMGYFVEPDLGQVEELVRGGTALPTIREYEISTSVDF